MEAQDVSDAVQHNSEIYYSLHGVQRAACHFFSLGKELDLDPEKVNSMATQNAKDEGSSLGVPG